MEYEDPLEQSIQFISNQTGPCTISLMEDLKEIVQCMVTLREELGKWVENKIRGDVVMRGVVQNGTHLFCEALRQHTMGYDLQEVMKAENIFLNFK